MKRAWVFVLLACTGNQRVPPPASESKARATPATKVADAGVAEPEPLTARRQHTATALVDGRVLVAGGETNDGGSAFVFDPQRRGWKKTGSMKDLRVRHVATALRDGRVLVAGGVNLDGELATSEVWSPASGTWTDAGATVGARQDHRAVVLPDGRVLVTGGRALGGIHESTELWDPTTQRWSEGMRMKAERYDHVLEILHDGRVLAVGGTSRDDASTTTVEVRDTKGAWKTVAPLREPRSQACSARLDDGRVLVAGGTASTKEIRNAPLATAELFDPKTSTWSLAGTMQHARQGCAMLALPGGRALVIGGYQGRHASPYVAAVEHFDGTTWSHAGSLTVGRTGATASHLGTRVLVVGGETRDGNATDEMFSVR